jgi:glycosyltransferase involved in cell wall biosynthesis
MALGKPVMCFIRKPEQYLLSPNECPILNTHVLSITNDLRDLIKRRDELEEIGKRSRQYIEKYYSIEAFATRLGKAYDDLGIKHD